MADATLAIQTGTSLYILSVGFLQDSSPGISVLLLVYFIIISLLLNKCSGPSHST